MGGLETVVEKCQVRSVELVEWFIRFWLLGENIAVLLELQGGKKFHKE